MADSLTIDMLLALMAVPENRELMAEVLWPAFFDQSRGRVLPETKDYGKTRWLHNGVDITANQAGAQVAAPGESYSDRINLVGGSVYWSDKPEQRQLNMSIPGAGGVVPYDFIIYSGYTSTEGATFTDSVGHTFKVYSTWALAWANNMGHPSGGAPIDILIIGTATINAVELSSSGGCAALHIYGIDKSRIEPFSNNIFTFGVATFVPPTITFHNITIGNGSSYNSGSALIRKTANSGVPSALTFDNCSFNIGTIYRDTTAFAGQVTLASSPLIAIANGTTTRFNALFALTSRIGTILDVAAGACFSYIAGDLDLQGWTGQIDTFASVVTTGSFSPPTWPDLTMPGALLRTVAGYNPVGTPRINVSGGFITHTGTGICFGMINNASTGTGSGIDIRIEGNTYFANVASAQFVSLTNAAAPRTAATVIVQGNTVKLTAGTGTGPAITVTGWPSAKVGPNSYGANWTTKYLIDAANNYEEQSLVAGVPAAPSSEPYVIYAPTANLPSARQYINVGVAFPSSAASPDGSFYWDINANALYINDLGSLAWRMPLKFRVYTSLGETPVSGVAF